jgi:hypothetical protein
MEVYKFLPKVRGGAQRAEGSVVEGKLLYYCLKKIREDTCIYVETNADGFGD